MVVGNWRVVFGNWRWYSETRIRKLEVVFGMVFGNYTVVFGNWDVVLGVVFGNLGVVSETGSYIRKLIYIIGNWIPGIENPRATTTQCWFYFCPSAELFNGDPTS